MEKRTDKLISELSDFLFRSKTRVSPKFMQKYYNGGANPTPAKIIHTRADFAIECLANSRITRIILL